ncbi:HYR-like domain-containing protein, partial [Planktosalinus lacus]|uniref:HYR-like domain-containing protein n=1 Tax=Planktosalinus lacus TaxID=1526573 RepID=UPI00166DC6A0
DSNGNPITPTGPAIGGTYVDCEGTVTYTWNYADCVGNNHDWVYTYTIVVEDFAINMPANEGSQIACASDAVAPVPPVVNDNCGNQITPTGPTQGGTYDGCDGTITFVWNYADCTGNNHDWVYTYTIELEAPILTGTVPVGATDMDLCFADIPAGPSEAEIAALYTDNCGIVNVTKTGTPTGDDCSWSVTYNYVIFNQCGLYSDDINITYSGSDQVDPALIADAPVGTQNANVCYDDAVSSFPFDGAAI